MPDLAALTLSEMVALSAALRRTRTGTRSMEEAAESVVRRLYDGLDDGEQRNCVLVRFFKTHRFDQLDETTQRAARSLVGEGELAGSTKCLTLLATAGDEPEWNDRRLSRGHRAVPLVSDEMIAKFPMISQLISQLGVQTSALLEADPELVVRLDEQTYNVFHVPEAVGSAHIPAQEDFVLRFGVRSVVGFGGMLASGDLFAVVLFSRAAVPARTAELLETLALSVKVAVQAFARGPTFRGEPAPVSPAKRPAGHHVRAVEQLLEVHERTVEVQAASLELAHRREQARSLQQRALAEATVHISLALTVEEILAVATEKARGIIGAHQAVACALGAGTADTTTAISLGERYERWRGRDPATTGTDSYAEVCKTNRPVRLTRQELEEQPRWLTLRTSGPERPPLLGWLAAPLISRAGQNLGLIYLSDRHEGDFTADDEAIIVQLAQFASVTIENAMAYAREHDLAVVLQHSLLPDGLAELAGLEVAVRYLPGSAGVEVGGDFYDVLPVSATEVALVIGDVAGHDLRAAISMGRVRHAIRAYAIEDPAPGSVMQRLNRLLVQESDSFTTALYLVLDLRSGQVRMANAGHPPPLVVDGATSTCSYLRCEPSPPIGVRPESDYETTTGLVPAGSTLVLYTDGLVERRGEVIDLGLERLLTAGASAADSRPGPLLAHLLDTLPGSTRPDDIALLAARVTPGAAPD